MIKILILNHCFSITGIIVVIVGITVTVLIVLSVLIVILVIVAARRQRGHVKQEPIEMEPEGMINLYM